jgi:flagellar protein FliJ
MSKAFPLKTLQHLAQHKNDAATRRLGQLNQFHLAAQSKLDMLQHYRKDYLEKMRGAELNGMELQDLRNFQDFIYRLNDAIAQQTNVVAQTLLSVEKGRDELNDSQRRMKSFDTLSRRHDEAEKKVEAKLEQKIQDEHSGRRIAYNNAEHSEEN